MQHFLRLLLVFVVGTGLFLVLSSFRPVPISAIIVPPSPEPSHQPLPSPSPSPSALPSPSSSPSPSPTFSCCEHDIKVNQVKANPQKTAQGVGTITVTIDFDLDIHWWCDLVANQDCFAFYDITLENTNWQEKVGGVWVDIPAANVTESIIPDQPLKVKCDGKGHKGPWSYSYIATITTANPIRNTGLIFDWDVPENKGTSYHAEFQVSGVSPTTGTKPPTVTGSHPKKK